MILACGEALVDLIPRTFGDEVAYVPRGGGSPYNVAVGLGRLEIPVGFVGRISRDPLGRLLRSRLADNGVDLRFTLEGAEPTTLAVVDVQPDTEPVYGFYGEGTADRLLRVEDLPRTFPDEVVALHFGSISLVREPGASAFEACMRREHRRRVLSLDPNVRPDLVGDRAGYLRRLADWVSLVDLVKVSRADLAWLYPGQPPEQVARQWLTTGPVLVVVTLGAEGAAGCSRDAVARAPAVEITVSDTVGAGDAFTSGLLAWLHESGNLTRERMQQLSTTRIADCLEYANRAAALACTRAGAEPPTRAEVSAAGPAR